MNREPSEFVDTAAAFEDGAVNPWYYEMQHLGLNYRITDMQCALAISQFGKLERFLARRRAIAAHYDEVLAGIPGLELAQWGLHPRSANHIYITRMDFAAIGRTRGEVMRELRSHGVGCQVHYIPVPYQPYYKSRGLSEGSWPNTQRYYEQALTIPLYYGMSDDDVAKVVDAVSGLFAGARKGAAARRA
jgi:dTDP-4-amino-4,6-dideoxygalactose transaminase